ncbi:MAG: pentapeptide repeat-containing protein, partial [Armatimonadota bacterium]|nr:pentapeptide repeat-containing protein [Armatimonadota bacterium]
MADQQHVQILLQGVNAWNQWREANPSIDPDLAAVNLAGADLREINFSGADLIAANLEGANLAHANLQRALLCDAKLTSAVLTGVDLTGTNMQNTILDRKLSSASNSQPAASAAATFAGSQVAPSKPLRPRSKAGRKSTGAGGESDAGVPRRYNTLRGMQGIYRGLAYISIMIIILALFAFFASSSQEGQGGAIARVSSIGVFLFGVVGAVTAFATAEYISVSIDNEHNTRLTAHLLEK